MNVEVTSPKKFVQVPIEKLNGLGLTPTDKIIFGSIYTMINVTNVCFMSNSKLAEDAEVSTRQVTRAITKLKEAGLIDVQLIYKENSKQVDKRYITLSDKYLTKNSDVDVYTPQTKSRGGIDTGVQGVPTKSRGGIDIDVQDNRLINRSSNRLINNTVKNDFDNESIDQKNKSKPRKITNQNKQAREDFEKLWKLYPKKKGKSKSFNYYVKAINDGVTNKEIQDGILNYVKDLKIKGTTNQYIKQGSTYFSERSWEDALDMQPNGNVRESVPDWIDNNNYEPPKQPKKQVDMSKLQEQLARRQANADN